MLKLVFLTVSAISALLFLVYKLWISKMKRTPKLSLYVPFMTAALLFYMLSAVFYSLVVQGIINKLIFLILGLSPLIIGKYATYEKEKFYAYLQILLVTFGFGYALII